VWLDVDDMNGSALELALHEAYLLVAPRALKAML
jgi:hypothetical protein